MRLFAWLVMAWVLQVILWPYILVLGLYQGVKRRSFTSVYMGLLWPLIALGFYVYLWKAVSDAISVALGGKEA
ncbi:MAG: hypothetical protein GTO63_07995 [Anaerolineae bacterium]|nr:hypothetical protein [Anaerolineae bacterium]NIN94871.1 hypothetical protein [Anaerolineae bacterium]NIQ77922.1 hypothetical protein [Anaerolineae bacterium]